MMEIDRTSFEAEVRAAGEALSPVRAGLLLARECAYPDLRPSDYLAQIDDLAAMARGRAQARADSLGQGLALGEWLFQKLEFRGNQADYANPRNSYLNQVLERRLGIPISLSVIFVELAQRLGVPAHGVGLPGHFIVAITGEDEPVLLDPFHGGRRLSVDDCGELVHNATGHDGPFDPEWLAPTPPRAIVARMLNNLRGFYVSVEDWPLSIKVVERLCLLQPTVSAHLRDLGILHYRGRAYGKGAALLNEYLTREPNAPDVAAVRERRDRLLDELAKLN